ncbi:peptidoglycan-binding protein [Plastorhodobacter daqingensis]|uniref:Peptidoglycan-binding protein n=1 Tax=Plastorhodobacter daqingensis TaxID=1387281 RepID=A0ABW2UIZ0_9RHOB
MRKLIGVLMLMGALWIAPALQAQEPAWIQVEAQPSLRAAEARARTYAAQFADVNGFRLPSGWYAIALGPYPTSDAATRLQSLLQDRRVPADAYVVDGDAFGQRFWPVATGLRQPLVIDVPPPEPAAQPSEEVSAIAAAPERPVASDSPAPATEPLEESLRHEALLSREDRIALQEALQQAGFYRGTIDAAIGPGTRSAMAAWQAAQGHEVTGVLSSAQRAALLGAQAEADAALGLARRRDEAAGIEVILPTALVQFDRYDPPFARYGGDAGVEIILVSQQGNPQALAGLRDQIRALPGVPAGGRDSFDAAGFEIETAEGARRAHVLVRLHDGAIRGYVVTWDDRAPDMAPILAAMRQSFAPIGPQTLDDLGAAPSDEMRAALLEGVAEAAPSRSATGVFLDAEGHVLTAAAAVAACTRISVDDAPAVISASDTATGLALLRPEAPPPPRRTAGWQRLPLEVGAPIVAAGFSLGAAMGLPALTRGIVAAPPEEGRQSLRLEMLPGDTGAPLLDGTGAVVGLLLPTETAGASLAITTAAVESWLEGQGISLPGSGTGQDLSPAALAEGAAGITTPVSCWN